MVITSRFRVFLAERELREGRSISLREVAKATGVSIYTISAFSNNTLREIPVDALAALCNYFGVSPGDLIVIKESPINQSPKVEPSRGLALAAA